MDGVEHATEVGWPARQDTRYSEDAGHGPVLEDEDGTSWPAVRIGGRRKRTKWLTAHQDESDPIETTFELNDTLYAKAEVPATEEVYIWLGANVMLAYPMDEAEALLAERLSKAKQSLEDCEEDLEFLREQITVSWLSTSLPFPRAPFPQFWGTASP